MTLPVKFLFSQTGQMVWRNENTSQMLNGQENFSGTPPHLNPIRSAQEREIQFGFTGIMQCFE